MKKVLIVDDEAIVRVTLRTLIRWENYNMQVAADCNSGYQALEYLRNNTVDLLITDVKMPEMSGIELLRRLQEENRAPLSIMLSGYNEFDLVREAFRLGAYDYILKADMNQENMERIIGSISRKYWGFDEKETAAGESGRAKMPLQLPENGTYGIAIFEIDDFQRQSARFSENLPELLEKPMLELVNQIPRVARRGELSAVQPGHYIFIYTVLEKEVYQKEMALLVRQMQAIWRDYMNLTVSAAVCSKADADRLEEVLDYGEKLLVLAPLQGKKALVAQWECPDIMAGMEEAEERYMYLLSCLYEVNRSEFEREKNIFFQRLDTMELQEAEWESLRLIALLAMKFREYDDDFYSVFPEEINYYDKLKRLTSIRGLQIWMSNYFSWILEYLQQRIDGVCMDIILKAKRFMADNYAKPELTLGSVADYVGLNEKYFTTRFTKETGTTFRDYLTGLRIAGAKRLLKTTDLKMYEISERSGYSNVEHFNRMFKKITGISPSDYRKSADKS